MNGSIGKEKGGTFSVFARTRREKNQKPTGGSKGEVVSHKGKMGRSFSGGGGGGGGGEKVKLVYQGCF